MESLQYMFLSTICLSISYITFRLFFKNETGFQKQRFFIIASVAISLLLPLNGITIELPEFSKGTVDLPAAIKQLSLAEGQIPAAGAEPGFLVRNSRYLIPAYLLIAMIFAGTVAFQLFRIMHLYIVSRKSPEGRIIVLTHRNIRSPFSFFRFVFIPENISDCEERRNILIHESIHASQYHSLDNLLIELTAAVMWFNPFVWMMKKSLHLIHEYLADEGTLGTGIDKISYQALLINQVAEERLICLSSSFNNSLIKKRMIMMTKSKNNYQNKKRILALLPLSVILFLTTSFINGFFPEKMKENPADTGNSRGSGFKITAGITTDQDTLRKKAYKVTKKNVREVSDEKVNKPGDRKKDEVEIYNFKKVVDLYDDTIDIRVDKDIDVEVDTDININVDETLDLDEDTVVVVKIDKNADLKEGKVKNVKVVKVVDPLEKVTVVKIRKSGQDDVKVIGYGGSDTDTMIYVVDGVHVKKIREINPDDIESVNVMKDDNLIIIRTKDKSGKKVSGENSSEKVRIVPDDVLYIIDGRTVDKGEFEGLDPGEIESISVLKGKEQVSKFTDEDYDGVIKIVTKDKR